MKENVNFPDSEVDVLEYPKGKSETIPGQALNIRQIMLRSLCGAILPEVQSNNLEFGDDEEFGDAFDPEIDLTDIEENNAQVDYLQKRVEQQKAAQKSSSKHPSETVLKTESEEKESLPVE